MRILLLFILFHTALSYSFSENARVFFVNINDESSDIRLGEESNPVYYTNGISPYGSTSIKTLLKTGKFRIYYKSSNGDDWKFWIDKKDNAKVLNINDGDLFCISLSKNGDISYYKLKEPDGKGALVCFLNATGEKLKKISVSRSIEDESEISVNNIDTKTMTNFGSIKEGDYCLFWQTISQNKNEFYFIEDDEKNCMKMPFKKGKYYVIISYKKGNMIYTGCYDISQ